MKYKTKSTKLKVVRDYDKLKDKWVNSYTIKLTFEGDPVPHKEIDFWYVEKHKPGYYCWDKNPIEKQMEMGGKLIKSQTSDEGIAKVNLPELDKIDDFHHSYKFVVRFNMDGRYPEYKPCQSLIYEFYSNHYQA